MLEGASGQDPPDLKIQVSGVRCAVAPFQANPTVGSESAPRPCALAAWQSEHGHRETHVAKAVFVDAATVVAAMTASAAAADAAVAAVVAAATNAAVDAVDSLQPTWPS